MLYSVILPFMPAIGFVLLCILLFVWVITGDEYIALKCAFGNKIVLWVIELPFKT